MHLSEPFIRRPVATTLLTLALALSGLFAFPLLPVAPLPQVDFPTIAVRASLPGASPETVAATLARPLERRLMFGLGLASLLSVPVFKAVTHLPVFLGILFGLGVLWTAGDLLHRGKPDEEREPLCIANSLKRIDLSAVVFFVGILLAVATLQHSGVLAALAGWLDRAIGRLDAIVLLIGLVSAVVDNVPMIAASIGMYPLAAYPADSFLWEFLAYAAGTGGSILIIGSAAGVAAMSVERIAFFWYLRRFSLLALIGYFAGAFAYIAQARLIG